MFMRMGMYYHVESSKGKERKPSSVSVFTTIHSSLSDPLHNMPSAQDPFYVVRAEIQESVSSSSFFSNYLGFAFCLIQIRNFNFSLNNSYGVLKMLQIWVNDGYRVFFFKF